MGKFNTLLDYLASAYSMIQNLISINSDKSAAVKAATNEETQALVVKTSASVAKPNEQSAIKANAGEALTVTSVMQPFLETLGINLSIGDRLSVSDFKSISRARYLATHPDKGGTQEEFCRMNEAAEQVMKIHFSLTKAPDADDFESYWVDFYNHIADRMEAVAAGMAEVSNEMEAVADKREAVANEMKAVADSMEVAANVMEVAADRIEVAAEILEATLKSQSEEIEKETRTMKEQIAELRRNYEARASSSHSSVTNCGLFSAR